jgi:hypothetical protein
MVSVTVGRRSGDHTAERIYRVIDALTVSQVYTDLFGRAHHRQSSSVRLAGQTGGRWRIGFEEVDYDLSFLPLSP